MWRISTGVRAINRLLPTAAGAGTRARSGRSGARRSPPSATGPADRAAAGSAGRSAGRPRERRTRSSRARRPLNVRSPRRAAFLRLVEEAAALEHAGALLSRDFDVSGREQEHLVGNALHAPVERIGEAAGEVDQALREVLVGALKVEDHGDTVLEAIGDLLRVVEAAR